MDTSCLINQLSDKPAEKHMSRFDLSECCQGGPGNDTTMDLTEGYRGDISKGFKKEGRLTPQVKDSLDISEVMQAVNQNRLVSSEEPLSEEEDSFRRESDQDKNSVHKSPEQG
jgi:hypothetical protein